MGDKLVVFWNVRSIRSDHATLCATCALQLHQSFQRLSTQQQQQQQQRPLGSVWGIDNVSPLGILDAGSAMPDGSASTISMLMTQPSPPVDVPALSGVSVESPPPPALPLPLSPKHNEEPSLALLALRCEGSGALARNRPAANSAPAQVVASPVRVACSMGFLLVF